ncbi:MAG: DUF4191 domain-containing protein [Actinomycetaceae bacterium]|nr:DUF4191 domain-containing protein [Actinomycetaceae bacterium]
MAKEDRSQKKAPAKRRWYHNFADAYRITKRTYPYIGWVLLAATVGAAALMIALGMWLKMHIVFLVLLTISTALLVPMLILASLVKKAMYRQIEGTMGAVYGVISQIKRGWTVEEQPIATNSNRDLVWRLIGRPGVVLITEGPTSRVRELANKERKMASRVVSNVPVHVINVGLDEGQTRLEELEKALRKLPKTLRSNEVPLVVNRLQAVAAKQAPTIPRGVDPARMKISRRALRGR